MNKLRRAEVLRHFKNVWERIFLSPVHLDSALSDVPAAYRSTIFILVTALLQRPYSLSRFLQLRLSPHEPWELNNEQISRWNAAAAGADRLWGSLQKEPDLLESDIVDSRDFPPYLQDAFLLATNNPKKAKQLAHALVQPSPVVLRLKRELPLRETLKMLKEKRVLPESAHPSSLSPTGIVIPDFTKVRHSEEFKNGFYEIQDDASQFLAYFALWPEVYGKFLQKKPGESPGKTAALPPAPSKNFIVIDACAGAGGKTLALADALDGKGRVYAYDVSEKKLLSLRQRARRADLHNIQTHVVPKEDAAASLKKFWKSADLVLVDAPCSGWGVLRRNPDIKWRQTADELDRLPELQFKLLEAYSTLVKPGGRLCFGVCTFREEESIAVVKRFTENSKFKLESMGYLGPIGCDGFFMASFKAPEGKSNA